MDHMKRVALLKYVSAIWRHEVTNLSELRDGTFFIHVLNMLDQHSKDSVYGNLNMNSDRLLCVKHFLQEFYGDSIHIEEYLKFDRLLGKNIASESQIELEIAKIAVVLLGIGVLDRNGTVFMSAALEVAVELQEDVLAMIQSVVVPDTTEVVLTDRIEQVLLESNVLTEADETGDVYRPETPTFGSKRATPRLLDTSFKADSNPRTPLKINTSLLNLSSQDISSPFKSLDIRSPTVITSPLVDFVQSPQLIQKAVLKQKDLELRRLREQLNAETLLKEEAQMSLQDTVTDCCQKNAEIAKLQERVRDLLSFQESFTELQEMKMKYANKEKEVNRMKEKILQLQTEKEDLEQMNTNQADEVARLHTEMACVSADWEELNALSQRVGQLESAIRCQERELAEMRHAKSLWQEEKTVLEENLGSSKEMNKRLQQELEELQARQTDTETLRGESMSIYMDIQLGELKCQLEEARQGHEALQKQFETSERDRNNLQERVQRQEQYMTKIRETNTSLSNALRIERDTSVKLKKRMEGYPTKYGEMKQKLETSQKEKDETASEIAILRKNILEMGNSQSTQGTKLALSTTNSETAADEDDDYVLAGYDSSDSTLNETVIEQNVEMKRDAVTCLRDISSCSLSQRSLGSMNSRQSSTVSLQSIQSVKEMLPGVLPNALSCAHEPDDSDFEWDQLSHLSLDGDKHEKSSPSKSRVSKKEGEQKPNKGRTPVKRGSREEGHCASPAKQKKSGGTVIYFPLDHNGPIYPLPKPTTQPRRTSGKFTPLTQQSTSDIDVPVSSSFVGKQRAPASPSGHFRYTPARRSSQKFKRASRQRLIRFPDDKF